MSQSHLPRPSDKDVREAEQRLLQQQALVRRLIVQGAPNQAAEDVLRQLHQAWLRIKEQRHQRRASVIHRKMRDLRSR
jgi:hypothetical protein